MVTHRRTFQRTISIAAYFRSFSLQRCFSTVKGLDKGCRQRFWTVAGVANDGEMLFVHDAISKSDVFRIYFDEILRVADAWPAAVVHETECGASFSSDRVERQPVAIEITGSNGRTGDGTEAGKHEGESLEAHLCTALEKER